MIDPLLWGQSQFNSTGLPCTTLLEWHPVLISFQYGLSCTTLLEWHPVLNNQLSFSNDRFSSFLQICCFRIVTPNSRIILRQCSMFFIYYIAFMALSLTSGSIALISIYGKSVSNLIEAQYLKRNRSTKRDLQPSSTTIGDAWSSRLNKRSSRN